MIKKVAFAVLTASLVFAAQAASADDTQFDIGGGRYLGASALPFHATGSDWNRMTTAPTPMPERLERTQAGADLPAPYNMPGGYFN